VSTRTYLYLQFLGALLAVAVFGEVWWSATILATQILIFGAAEVCDAIKEAGRK